MVGVGRLELPAGGGDAAPGCFAAAYKKIASRLHEAGSSLTSILQPEAKEPIQMDGFFHFGRSGEARTPGLMVPNHARYQLRYTPMKRYKT